MAHRLRYTCAVSTILLTTLASTTGCHTPGTRIRLHQTELEADLSASDIPRELDKVSLPAYVIEPPDVLLIEAIKIVPKPPYRIEPLDVLSITVRETLPLAPIAGLFAVDADGTVNLGPEYGTVRVTGLTLEGAKETILTHLKEIIVEPQVAVELAQTQGLHRITGEHLVRLDETIGLGSYGDVRVAGLTLAEAKTAIDAQLASTLLDPKVYVDVVEYNSKVCYIITDGAGLGEQISRFPISGNETVLDVVSQINGLPPVSSKKRIWMARPAPAGTCCDQIMPVDWQGITQRGATATNYQVLPGDRIYIHSDELVAFANFIDKFTAPFERMMGFTLLGHSTVRTLQFGHRGTGFGNFGGGNFGGGFNP